MLSVPTAWAAGGVLMGIAVMSGLRDVNGPGAPSPALRPTGARDARSAPVSGRPSPTAWAMGDTPSDVPTVETHRRI